jgi:3-methyl-2-oxobutanoate hydroxymethyltransferase
MCASRISKGKISIPTIGIGAGKFCDGQVLVTHDLLGLFDRFRPKFVKQYLNLWPQILNALKEFCEEVKGGKFPSDEHSFKLKKETAENLFQVIQ